MPTIVLEGRQNQQRTLRGAGCERSLVTIEEVEIANRIEVRTECAETLAVTEGAEPHFLRHFF